MFSLTIEIVVIFLLILLNGIFAMSEMAIVSARKVRLQQLVNQGNVQARKALKLTDSPNQFLSTVQIGITLIGTLAGAFGGATLANKLATPLQQIPLLAANAEAIAIFVVVVSISYLSLVFGELVPKRLALNSPERISMAVASPMRFLAKVAAPAVHVLSFSTETVLRLLGITPSTEPEVTEEEIKLLIEQGTEAGTFEEVEQEMLNRVLRLDERRASTLMTPRLEIVWLDLDDSVETNRHTIMQNPHSQYPVCEWELDNVLGIVSVNELLSRCLNNQPFDLTTSLIRPLYVPESTPGLKILELFKQSNCHFAFVVDEYGVIQGLVTLNDILEAIVGDLPSIAQVDEPTVVQREDGSWLVDGMLPIDEFFDVFEIKNFHRDTRSNYHTVGGFVVTHLGRIPTASDSFEWRGFRFEVMDMDGNRVDKVLVELVNNQQGISTN